MFETDGVLQRLFMFYVLIASVLALLGTCSLIYVKFNTHLQGKLIFQYTWWAIELIALSLVVVLFYRFFILEIHDRRSQGLINYLMAIWFSPAIACGVVSLFLKPHKF